MRFSGGTVHKHYTAERRSVTLLNFARRVRARSGPLPISMHSHLPLSCQSRSLTITTKHPPPPPQPVIDTLTHGMSTSTAADRGIWIASLAQALWTVEPLETFCRHVVQAVPFSFQCSRSALPPVICALSSQQSTCWQGLNVRGVTTAATHCPHAGSSCRYAALLTEGRLIPNIVGTNRHGS